MKARILDVTVENFGSVRRADYRLADLGLCLVEGRNFDDPGSPSNGAGKSTLFLDAPTWCLHAKSRDVATDDVINDIAQAGCVVTARVELPDVGLVSIQRYRRAASKSGARVWVGVRVEDLAHAQDQKVAFRPYEITSLDPQDTQRKIEELLGLDLEVWRAAVYRAQDDEARFAALRDSQQKQLLTRVFHLDQIDVWRDVASTRASELEDRVTEISARLAAVESAVRARNLDELRNARALWEQDRARRHAELTETVAQHVRAWPGIKTQVDRIAALRLQIDRHCASAPTPAQLELLPPEPGHPLLRPEPSAPIRRTPRAATVGQPPEREPLPVLTLTEMQTLEQTAQREAANASGTEAVLEQQQAAVRQRSAAMAEKRSGRCNECGSELSPEHAQREAARLASEADGLWKTAQRWRESAAAASGRAAALNDQIQGLRKKHFEECHAIESKFAARMHAWRQDLENQQAQAVKEAEFLTSQDWSEWRKAYAAWELEVQTARTSYAGELEEWRRAFAEISRRNADREAEARTSIEAKIAPLHAELALLANAPESLKACEQTIRQTEAARSLLQGERWPLESSLQQAEQLDQADRAKLAELSKELANVEPDLRLLRFWVEGFGPRGMKGAILDERVQELTDRANAWLRVLTRGVYWVRFETQSATQDGKLVEKFSTRVFRHRPTGGIAERRWGQWSGGQKSRVGVGIDLALAETIGARAKRSYDLLVLDEVFRHLDAGGRETMLEALQVLRRDRGSVIVVDHDPQFRAAFERRVLVELRGEESRIVGYEGMERAA